MRVVLHGHDLPGRTCDVDSGPHANVHVGVQRKRDVVEVQPGDAASVAWAFDVDVIDTPDGAVDLRGPHVQGKRGDRFFYLSWGAVDGAGAFTMFRRAKLMIDGVPPAVLAAARRDGTLTGALGLTLLNGAPVCAATRPPRITWTAGSSHDAPRSPRRT